MDGDDDGLSSNGSYIGKVLLVITRSAIGNQPFLYTSNNFSVRLDRNLVMPVAPFNDSVRRRMLHNDAVAFTAYASSAVSLVEPIETVLRTGCCYENCYRDLSWYDIFWLFICCCCCCLLSFRQFGWRKLISVSLRGACALVRGRLVQLMESNPDRTRLRKFIVAFLNERYSVGRVLTIRYSFLPGFTILPVTVLCISTRILPGTMSVSSSLFVWSASGPTCEFCFRKCNMCNLRVVQFRFVCIRIQDWGRAR